MSASTARILAAGLTAATLVVPVLREAEAASPSMLLVVPGERIGDVQLIERVSDLQRRFGMAMTRQAWPSLQESLDHDWGAEYYLQARFAAVLPGSEGGRGLWDGTALYEWKDQGLAVAADRSTGALLWISLCACGPGVRPPVSTDGGLAFGATEEQVVAADVLRILGGPPERISGPAVRWIYRAEGIAVSVGRTFKPGVVLGVSVFAP